MKKKKIWGRVKQALSVGLAFAMLITTLPAGTITARAEEISEDAPVIELYDAVTEEREIYYLHFTDFNSNFDTYGTDDKTAVTVSAYIGDVTTEYGDSIKWKLEMGDYGQQDFISLSTVYDDSYSISDYFCYTIEPSQFNSVLNSHSYEQGASIALRLSAYDGDGTMLAYGDSSLNVNPQIINYSLGYSQMLTLVRGEDRVFENVRVSGWTTNLGNFDEQIPIIGCTVRNIDTDTAVVEVENEGYTWKVKAVGSGTAEVTFEYDLYENLPDEFCGRQTVTITVVPSMYSVCIGTDAPNNDFYPGGNYTLTAYAANIVYDEERESYSYNDISLQQDSDFHVEWLFAEETKGVSLTPDPDDASKCAFSVDSNCEQDSFEVICFLMRTNEQGIDEEVARVTQMFYKGSGYNFTADVTDLGGAICRGVEYYVYPEVRLYNAQYPNGISLMQLEGAKVDVDAVSTDIEVTKSQDGYIVLRGIDYNDYVYYTVSWDLTDVAGFEDEEIADSSDFNHYYCVSVPEVWAEPDYFISESDEQLEIDLALGNIPSGLDVSYEMVVAENENGLGQNSVIPSNAVRDGNEVTITIPADALKKFFAAYNSNNLIFQINLLYNDTVLTCSSISNLHLIREGLYVEDMEMTLLPGDSWSFDKEYGADYYSKDYPYGQWINCQFTSIACVENGNNVSTVSDSETRYWITGQNVGRSVYELTYEYEIDGETKTGKTYRIVNVVEQKWQMGVCSEYNTWDVVPGQTLNLNAEVCFREYICTQDESYIVSREIEPDDNIYVEWIFDEQGENKAPFTICPGSDYSTACSVTIDQDATPGTGYGLTAQLVQIDAAGNRYILETNCYWLFICEAALGVKYNAPQTVNTGETAEIFIETRLFTRDCPQGILADEIKGADYSVSLIAEDYADEVDIVREDVGTYTVTKSGKSSYINFQLLVECDFSNTEYSDFCPEYNNCMWFEIIFKEWEIDFLSRTETFWIGENPEVTIVMEDRDPGELTCRVYQTTGYEDDPLTEGQKIEIISYIPEDNTAEIILDGQQLAALYEENGSRDNYYHFCFYDGNDKMVGSFTLGMWMNVPTYLEDYGLELLLGESCSLSGMDIFWLYNSAFPEGTQCNYSIQSIAEEDASNDSVVRIEYQQDRDEWVITGIKTGETVLKVDYTFESEGQAVDKSYFIYATVAEEMYSVEWYITNVDDTCDMVPGETKHYVVETKRRTMGQDGWPISEQIDTIIEVEIVDAEEGVIVTPAITGDGYSLTVSANSSYGAATVVMKVYDAKDPSILLQEIRNTMYVCERLIFTQYDYWEVSNLVVGQETTIPVSFGVIDAEHPEGYIPDGYALHVYADEDQYEIANHPDGTYTFRRVSPAGGRLFFDVIVLPEQTGVSGELMWRSRCWFNEVADKPYGEYYSAEGFSASLWDDGRIGLNLRATIPFSMEEKLQLSISLVGDEVPFIDHVSIHEWSCDWENDGMGTTALTFFTSVNADWLNREIYFEISDEEGKVWIYESISVAAYLETLLEDQTGEYAEYTDIAKALLNYGACAQEYFGTDLDSLANACLTEKEREVSLLSQDVLAEMERAKEFPEVKGLTYYGSSMMLRNGFGFRHYFILSEGYTAKQFSDDYTVLENKEGDLYFYDTGDMALWNLDVQFEDPIPGTEDIAMVYSAYDYIRDAYENSADAELLKLLSALYTLGMETKNFIQN